MGTNSAASAQSRAKPRAITRCPAPWALHALVLPGWRISILPLVLLDFSACRLAGDRSGHDAAAITSVHPYCKWVTPAAIKA
jgi:hypothetical protein